MHAGTFEELVAPLEDATGQRLNGSARTVCMQAFEECPDGVRACARKALLRAHSNPVGLFVKMVAKDGEHKRTGRPNERDTPPATPFDRMLRWAERTAPLLGFEHREEVLSESGLNADELEAVRVTIAAAESRRLPLEAA